MIGKQGVSLLIGHNGVQDKTTLNPANETVNKGVYDATLLSTVDVDLAVGNIKLGETIFGFLGTFAGGALTQDVIGTGYLANTDTTVGYRAQTMAGGADYTMASITRTYAANSLMGAIGMATIAANRINSIKVRMNMGGVQVYESGYAPLSTTSSIRIVHSETRVLVGAQVCDLVAHNYDASSTTLYIYGATDQSGKPISGGVFVVSMVLA